MSTRCMGCMRIFDTGAVCPTCGFNSNSRPEVPGDLGIYTIISDRYIIGKVIRRSAINVTYLAWDNRMDKSVNVTEYFPKNFVERQSGDERVYCKPTSDVMAFEGCKSSVYSQGRMFARFQVSGRVESTPNYIDCFENNGTVYTVTDTIGGSSLNDIIASGRRFNYSEVKTVLFPVIETLARFGEERINHCNITPDSLYVDNTGKAKIVDFCGAGNIQCLSAAERGAYLNGLYIAPEVFLEGKEPGESSDVYSICKIMYVMICGAEALNYPLSADSLRRMGVGYNVTETIMNGLQYESSRVGTFKSLLTGLREAEKKDANSFQTNPPVSNNPPVPPTGPGAGNNVNPPWDGPRITQQPTGGGKNNSTAKILIIAGVSALVLISILIIAIVAGSSGSSSRSSSSGSGRTTTQPDYYTDDTDDTDDTSGTDTTLSVSNYNTIKTGETYTFTTEYAGTYIFESTDSDGNIFCGIHSGEEYVGGDSYNSADGTNFRVAVRCNSYENLEFCAETTGSEDRELNLKIYTASVEEGTNNLPYLYNIQYNIDVSESGYYLFDSRDSGSVKYYKNESESYDDDYFVSYVYAHSDSYVELYGCSDRSAKLTLTKVPELSIGDNICNATNTKFYIYKTNSSGYYRFTCDTAEFSYHGDSKASAVKNYSSYSEYTYEYIVHTDSSDTILISFNTTGSHTLSVRSATERDYNGFVKYMGYLDSGIYLGSSNTLYYDHSTAGESCHFTDGLSRYPVTYYVDSSNNLWLGFQATNSGSEYIIWYKTGS